jgi:hypothetical protein
MKFKEYKVKDFKEVPYFCPNCHKKIEPPEWLLKGNVKVENGLNLQCGICSKGKVRIYKYG